MYMCCTCVGCLSETSPGQDYCTRHEEQSLQKVDGAGWPHPGRMEQILAAVLDMAKSQKRSELSTDSSLPMMLEAVEEKAACSMILALLTTHNGGESKFEDLGVLIAAVVKYFKTRSAGYGVEDALKIAKAHAKKVDSAVWDDVEEYFTPAGPLLKKKRLGGSSKDLSSFRCY